ncbi:MAG TPA: pyridoxal-dependent decarboxylase [Stackebrandtia sp.]|jgi:glutamate/tyrosine decarboxylase-like PLP-dependent enzyme|uniref:pyridoxal phosphate-dependent decarboxylase family protein n=1 Tax=Stackebrandtia sp. TaxID=2023065 RepID=UPI002D49D9A8|nr:pyridoxal-dependent decarboxylase [Stackebrandtia sp.]HZE38251.1 pyridoxal-dependent decarboxylase [Stackebrandtia sp.]
MDQRLAEDLARFDELLDAARRRAARALSGLDSRSPAATGRPPAAEPLPEYGVGAEGALERFGSDWEPGLSGSAGPRYLGFVTGGATPAAVMGDWLTGVLDQNAAGDGRSVADALELQTVTWLGELFGLGCAHSGSFVTGATMSNAVGLAIGREWVGERQRISVAEHGVAAVGPITVLSGTPHSSIYKALSLLGIGRASLRTLPTLPGREAVDPAALDAALSDLDGRPAIVVSNAGTVNTVDFDDLNAVIELRNRHDFWWHVDAAFGGFAAACPDHARLTAGIDRADSVCVDLHKWLNVPYDSAVQFTRRKDLQIRVFQSLAPYLGAPGDDPAYLHLTPESSRRLRALTAWFTLAAYGRAGHREIVRRNIAAARRLGARLSDDPRLWMLAPVRLNVVCATLADRPTAERVATLVKHIAESGEAFVTPTVYRQVPALRVAFSNWRTTMDDVDRVGTALLAAVDKVDVESA